MKIFNEEVILQHILESSACDCLNVVSLEGIAKGERVAPAGYVACVELVDCECDIRSGNIIGLAKITGDRACGLAGADGAGNGSRKKRCSKERDNK